MTFKDKLTALIADIYALELSSELKMTFFQYIKNIIEAIDMYQITGVEPIMEALEATPGHGFVDPEYLDVISITWHWDWVTRHPRGYRELRDSCTGTT